MDRKEQGEKTADKKALISGAGIAGLTVGTLLAEDGWDIIVVEKDSELRTEGYMMDFFGAGWDVAERMGILNAVRGVRYPIAYLEYVDREGKPGRNNRCLGDASVGRSIPRIRKMSREAYRADTSISSSLRYLFPPMPPSP
jgi:2-polyprenyl-6-methoxyphenol hydroxylase-like FAD-dependent oxidoreductase